MQRASAKAQLQRAVLPCFILFQLFVPVSRKRHLEEAASAKEIVLGKESGTYEYELCSRRGNVRPHCPLAVPHAAAPFEACCARLPGIKNSCL